MRRDGSSALTISSPASRSAVVTASHVVRVGAELAVGTAAQHRPSTSIGVSGSTGPRRWRRGRPRDYCREAKCGRFRTYPTEYALRSDSFARPLACAAVCDGRTRGVTDRAREGVTDPLAPLLELPGVAEAVAAARAAVDALLGNRVLRRRSADVSAESSLRGAWASAVLSGVDVTLADVRSGAAADRPVVQGALRAQAAIPALADTWTRAPRQALARLHALAAADLVDARCAGPADRAARSGSTRWRRCSPPPRRRPSWSPASSTASCVSLDAFAPSSGVVARTAVRLTLIERGLDPKSLVVVEAGHLELAGEYRGGARCLPDGYAGGYRGVAAALRGRRRGRRARVARRSARRCCAAELTSRRGAIRASFLRRSRRRKLHHLDAVGTATGLPSVPFAESVAVGGRGLSRSPPTHLSGVDCPRGYPYRRAGRSLAGGWTAIDEAPSVPRI